MPSLSALKKAAEKRAKAEAGKGTVKGKWIQGLILEKELAVIDHILINDLQFINVDGAIVDYIDNDRGVTVDVPASEGSTT